MRQVKNMRQFQNSRQTGYHDKPRKLSEHDLEVMHLPQRFWAARRDAIPEETMLREKVEAFCLDVPSVMRNPNLSLMLLHGIPGTGKTSAAAIMAKAARAHRYTVFYLDAAGILRTFMDGTVTGDEVLTHRDRAYETELLILDGLGYGHAKSEYVASEVTALVKHRQEHQKMTLVTTSMDDKDIAALYGNDFLARISRTAAVVRCIHNFDGGTDA